MHPLSVRDVVLHGNAVVHQPVLEEVAPRIDVRDGLSVIADLVVVGRTAVGNGVGHAMEDAGRADVGRDHLRFRVGERHDDAVPDQAQGAGHLLRRDQIGRASVDSWPTGAHFPHVLNSVRQRSYCARSAAVSGGAAGAGACATTATVRPAHTAIDCQKTSHRSSLPIERVPTETAAAGRGAWSPVQTRTRARSAAARCTRGRRS